MSKEIIRFVEAQYKYKSQDGIENRPAISDINVKIEQGQFVVVIGRNGSGKSTFARLINALILPTSGTVYIDNNNTVDDAVLWNIRQLVGMVFQNPDNQLVATSVEEDVAFGPENLGIKSSEIKLRVEEALKAVGMLDQRKTAPHNLSGGQKQKIAIAGILAMKPKCIILDESTSMLDPIGRKEVLTVLKKLNVEENITVIHITHHMNEAVYGDRVIVIDEGKIVKEGEPKEVFSNVEEMKKIGLDVPQVTELLYELKKEGVDVPLDIIDVDEAAEVIWKLYEAKV
jgi:energy-coupling factor transport system ATP-binding protein